MQAFKDKLCATLVDFLRKAPQRFLIHFDGLSFDLINLSMNRFVTCVPSRSPSDISFWVDLSLNVA